VSSALLSHHISLALNTEYGRTLHLANSLFPSQAGSIEETVASGEEARPCFLTRSLYPHLDFETSEVPSITLLLVFYELLSHLCLLF
jgi:hypothetical protein